MEWCKQCKDISTKHSWWHSLSCHCMQFGNCKSKRCGCSRFKTIVHLKVWACRGCYRKYDRQGNLMKDTEKTIQSSLKKAGWKRATKKVAGLILEMLPLEKGHSIIISHKEYAELHGEPDAIKDGRYTKNSPEYREVRIINKHFEKLGRPERFIAYNVIVPSEEAAKKLGMKIRDYAFQIKAK